jgi:hypothetical protein
LHGVQTIDGFLCGSFKCFKTGDLPFPFLKSAGVPDMIRKSGTIGQSYGVVRCIEFLN